MRSLGLALWYDYLRKYLLCQPNGNAAFDTQLR